MNCHAGDLAIIVRGDFAGGMVECLQYLGTIQNHKGRVVERAWLVDPLSPATLAHWRNHPGTQCCCSDDDLRPIKGTSDTEDASCTTPTTKTATA